MSYHINCTLFTYTAESEFGAIELILVYSFPQPSPCSSPKLTFPSLECLVSQLIWAITIFLMFVSSCFFRIRIAGIRGIQGVVRKTVNDELQAIVWEPQHMDKIVPSLLFNMHKIEDVDR